MLYDEPTTGLDPAATSKIITLINNLHDERHICSVMVTHQIADALAVGDRFVVVVAGEVAFDGTLEMLRDSNDPRVIEFLSPFRDSFERVRQKKFA
jgi:phospholipid/cholesterol/gamma-HCH transport system ATP-binding protein